VNVLFVIIFTIATSPVLLTLFGTLIGGVILFAVLNSNKKKRAAKAAIDKIVQEVKQTQEAGHSLIVQRYTPEIAERLLKGEVWQGMTAEQLMDSMGRAEAVDTVVTKTKQKEIWKYYQETATRFGMRITLENGIVVGWVQK
jgi:Na+-transporting NADH:ubiquinone oxidoreductase subunit NqrA